MQLHHFYMTSVEFYNLYFKIRFHKKEILEPLAHTHVVLIGNTTL